MPGTHAQKVSFTALGSLEQFPPASRVTDELGLADADVEAEAEVLALAELDVPAAAAVEELLLPLLHAARPVTAASAAIPPSASGVRLVLDLVLSVFIGDYSFVFPCAGARLRGGARTRSSAGAGHGSLDDCEGTRRQREGQDRAGGGRRRLGQLGAGDAGQLNKYAGFDTGNAAGNAALGQRGDRRRAGEREVAQYQADVVRGVRAAVD